MSVCTRCGLEANTSSIIDGAGRPTGEFWCCACWNQSVADRRAARKAELAAMDRCEKAGCSRRGSWKVGLEPTVLLCGQHKNAAKRKLVSRLAPVASIAMFTDTRQTGRQLLAMLEETA